MVRLRNDEFVFYVSIKGIDLKFKLENFFLRWFWENLGLLVNSLGFWIS